MSDEDAILLFNHIKETYSQKIEELNDLKRQIFSTDQIDQQQRSKLRITIESLLIDLNEEIFSISEELAKSFTFESKKGLFQKASEFEQRMFALLKKIKDTIDQNQSVKIIRRQAKIQNLSPPSKDLNTFGLQTQESDRLYHYKQSSKKQVSSPSVQLKKNLSTSKIVDPFSTQTDTNQREEMIMNADMVTAKPATHSQRSSVPKQKKSPIPLRRKEAASFVQEGRNHSNSSKKLPSMNSAKKQLFSKDKENKKDQQLKKNIKKIEEFEKYLARKQGVQLQVSANKENKKPDDQSMSTVQLQSEAFENFSQEFAHMKNKFLQMQSRLSNQEEKSKDLEDIVEKLKTDNLKLNTDVKIIRNEHSEILHSLFSLEKKNSQLTQENQALKRILTGERELKGQEANLPKPYIENDQSMTQGNNERKASPFSSFLQKNRSFNNLRESKDSNVSLSRTNEIGNNTQTNFNFKVTGNNTDFVSFQPSMNQTYKQLNESGEREVQQPYYHVRSSGNKNWPSSQHNPLLSVSNDRGLPSNINNSFLQQQQQQPPTIHSAQRPISGPSSRRGDQPQYSRVHDTPTTPEHIHVMTSETPNQRMEDFDGGRQRTFNIKNQRLTPTSSSQQIMMVGTPHNQDAQLSDWVIERLNNKRQ